MSNSFIYHVYNIYNYYVQELIILKIFLIDFRYKLSNENQGKIKSGELERHQNLVTDF